jgi:hypothetical protein
LGSPKHAALADQPHRQVVASAETTKPIKRGHFMKPNSLHASVVAGLILLGAGLPAQATPITWNLNGLTFDDGTTATGSFVFDANTHTSSSFNVSTMAGDLPAFTYNIGNSGLYYGGGFGPNNFVLFTDDGGRYFNFSFTDALTDAGGTVSLVPFGSYECFNCTPYRLVVAGSVSSSQAPTDIPEPGSLALVAPALGLLGFMTRRRKTAAR